MMNAISQQTMCWYQRVFFSAHRIDDYFRVWPPSADNDGVTYLSRKSLSVEQFVSGGAVIDTLSNCHVLPARIYFWVCAYFSSLYFRHRYRNVKWMLLSLTLPYNMDDHVVANPWQLQHRVSFWVLILSHARTNELPRLFFNLYNPAFLFKNGCMW